MVLTIVEDHLGIQVLVKACTAAMVVLAPGKAPLIVMGPSYLWLQKAIEHAVAVYLRDRTA